MHISQLPKGVPTKMLIGGEWVNAKDGAITEVIDPATTEVLAGVPLAGEAEAMDAVSAAYNAQPEWERRAPRDRSEILRRSYEHMLERSEEIARVIVLENGKSLADARGEVAYAAEFFRWYAEEAVRQTGIIQRAPSGSNQIMVLRQAIGVAVLVTPWNFPAAMATRKIAPALAAGCTVILKPATDTPLTALLIAKILVEAGVPAGVVNVLPSRGSSNIVSKMLHDLRVRKLSFTGSTPVGRTLLHEAADTVINSSMELGGNAPFLVFADADLDAAVAGAMIAKMRNGGEACTAANRFYVEAPVARAFSARFAAAMGALKMGPGLADGVELGPLINQEAQEKVEALVGDALDRGAHLLSRAEPWQGKGYFVQPAVLEDVDPTAQLLKEEIFGPVAAVTSFETEDEAISLANATEFGLISYLYTGDLAKGLRVAEALEAGMIGLNRGLVSDPAAPFGGVKQSGLGREGGQEGVLEYTEAKYIATSWS
ncbi:NAD-dependent succinate-semialdehyde dehydrogenase [Ferrimicrobium sp.]|uniref:NAD-dependent succinate-semialdehyde dehydrogenase n=1 Tax=Ferrimicrobium sp. TaxID=2926050 RepID=UPI002618B5D9|nr:NAD-dependent succinate-semialdehyde dehydrogenase [Ferrimicrobium sp.]